MSVRKHWLLVTAILGICILAGCGQDSKNVQSIEAIRYAYESDGDSLIPQPIKSWILTDEEDLSRFLTAMDRRSKIRDKIDIRPRDYAVHISYDDGSDKEYDLWLDEDVEAKGMLMEGDMSWFIDEDANQALQGLLR